MLSHVPYYIWNKYSKGRTGMHLHYKPECLDFARRQCHGGRGGRGLFRYKSFGSMPWSSGYSSRLIRNVP